MQPYSYVRTLICMHDRTHIRRLAHLCAALGPIALFGCAFDHLIDECVMFGSVLGNSLVGGGEVEGGVDVQVPAFVNEVACEGDGFWWVCCDGLGRFQGFGHHHLRLNQVVEEA